jgi:hypothetical protein
MAFPRLVLAVSALAAAFIVALSHPGAVAAQGTSIPALKQLQALISSQQESAKLAKSDPITYAWDLFFYTNWPALTGPNHRGQPDPKKAFGHTGPVVWETWKNTITAESAAEEPVRRLARSLRSEAVTLHGFAAKGQVECAPLRDLCAQRNGTFQAVPVEHLPTAVTETYLALLSRYEILYTTPSDLSEAAVCDLRIASPQGCGQVNVPFPPGIDPSPHLPPTAGPS